MRYGESLPGREAAQFVERYWVLEQAEAGAVQRVVPDGRPELILNLGAPFEMLRDGAWQAQPKCFLAGQITGPLLLRARAGAHIVGVRLRPAGAAQLLGMPANELTGQCIELEDLGLAALSGRDDLAGIEKSLLERRTGEPDLLVEEAARLLSESADVAGAAQHLGVSARQLERRFQAGVGLTPKLFARIRRFQRVFPAIENAGAGWVDGAAACGYYDQAHLIRDFRDFAGEPPAALLAGHDLARHFLSHFSKTGGGCAV
jgi:AraC-like DNA-binding protein